MKRKLPSFFNRHLPRPWQLPGSKCSAKSRQDIFSRAWLLEKELQIFIGQAWVGQISKATLIVAIRQQLLAFPEIREPAFRIAIEHFIAGECQRNGLTVLTVEEIHFLWPWLPDARPAPGAPRLISYFLNHVYESDKF
jgi:hypothetical protein